MPEAQLDRFLGQLKQSYLLILSGSGKLTLPEQTIRWWDTDEQVLKETSLPGETFMLLSETDTSSREKPSDSSGNSFRLNHYTSLSFLLLALASTLILCFK